MKVVKGRRVEGLLPSPSSPSLRERLLAFRTPTEQRPTGDTQTLATMADRSFNDAPSSKSQELCLPTHATPSSWDDPRADPGQNEQKLTSQALAYTTTSAISGMPPLPGLNFEVNVLPQILTSEGIVDILVSQIGEGEETVHVFAPRVVKDILGFTNLAPQFHSLERFVKHTALVSVPIMCPFLL